MSDSRPQCPICQELTISDGYALLYCSHVFHRECITCWFRGSSRECPVCRHPVDSDVLADLGIGGLQPFPPYPSTSTPPTIEYYESDENEVNIRSNSPQFHIPDHWRIPQERYFPQISTRERIWESVNARLLEGDTDQFDSSEDEGGDTGPLYYEISTLKFLRDLCLSEEEYEQVVLFKRRRGKYALSDAVNRVKVFLALDSEFRFTSVEDMLHKCKFEPNSARPLERVFKKYLEQPALHVNMIPSRIRGSVYNFFDVPDPSLQNRASMELERYFRTTIQKVFGVILTATSRGSVSLRRFYRDWPNNLHDMLQFAKLKAQEKNLKRRMDELKQGTGGCNGRHVRTRV